MRLGCSGRRRRLLRAALLRLVVLVLVAPPRRCAGESATCLAVYREGGAPAVFQSAHCPRWTLLAPSAGSGGEGDGDRRSSSSSPPPPPHPRGCHVAVDRGRRRSQEDRAVCALGIRIPFIEHMRIKEVDVGVVAVFDGHNGAEASEMASKLLLEYFLLHVYFLLDGIYSIMFRKSTGKLTYKEVTILNNVINLYKEDQSSHSKGSCWALPAILDRSFHMEVLKESLLRAVHDVDLTFSKEGKRRRKRNSNNRDDFALANYDGPFYNVKELTKDHHPDREDERSRVEAAGGYVLEWAGVHRVNGELALSRAIGDVPYKRYGVIPTPELTEWQSLSANDTFLIASSDGVFEKMTMQDVCDLMLRVKLGVNQELGSFAVTQRNLADYVVDLALEKGTTDNVAAVIVPLGSHYSSKVTLEDWYMLEENSKTSISPLQTIPYQQKSDDGVSSALIGVDYYKRSSAKFHRFLVEAKMKRLGCFYLSESLDEDMDYIFRVPEAYQHEGVNDFDHSLVETVLFSDGNLDKYKDRDFCWYLGHQDGEMGRCHSPEAFANFFGLLDSVSHNGSKPHSSHSFGYKISDFRYKLKKRFDRGSYGEVWLAFHWNCSEDVDVHKDHSHFNTILKPDSYNCTSSNTTLPDENHDSDTIDGDLFILKRIMVERGRAAYLSGLREKYFGELFSNASRTLEALSRAESSTAFSVDSQLNPHIFAENNMSFTEEPLKHIARFIESFESELKELWLVYRNEGRSLSKLIYTAEETKLVTGNNNERVRHIQVLQPSKWWYWLRTTKAGQKQMQNLLWQLLMGLKACHDRNITHRDIKPENMIICFEDLETGKCLREIPSEAKHNKLNMRLIDFGSAFDDFTLKHLYDSGPTRSEQTFEYTPPEALLNSSWFQGSKSARLKYDMWSVGVVMLELIVGSPHVFQISDRTRALMDHRLEGWSEQTKELAYKLRSYMELCILVPGISSQHQGSGDSEHGQFRPASWKCSEESFAHQVKIRDPLKMGWIKYSSPCIHNMKPELHRVVEAVLEAKVRKTLIPGVLGNVCVPVLTAAAPAILVHPTSTVVMLAPGAIPAIPKKKKSVEEMESVGGVGPTVGADVEAREWNVGELVGLTPGILSVSAIDVIRLVHGINDIDAK
uniref:protein-serine/threonine phosphatase n=1 Tax=Oryza rufipogon TaxID=4529 RepID=A0A0E0RA86_ORYRU